MNAWPHGVIVVPTVPTTASQYSGDDDELRDDQAWSAAPQSGLRQDRRDDVGDRDEARRSPTNRYWTRL